MLRRGSFPVKLEESSSITLSPNSSGVPRVGEPFHLMLRITSKSQTSSDGCGLMDKELQVLRSYRELCKRSTLSFLCHSDRCTMREFAEFRVVEEFAPRLFADNEGKRLGDSVRKVELATDDPRFVRIGELQKETRQATDRSFFYGWKFRRRYTKTELTKAEIFRLGFASTFEPAGEECGTKYDETTACIHCGAGAKQIGPLFLDVKRIPRGKDFARTIAGEKIVSRRVVELFSKAGVSGVSFHPVRTKGGKSLELGEWRQLVVHAADAEIVAPTRVGIDPFDDDPRGECRCSAGDLIGLNLLSEVSINVASCGESDVAASRQFIGVRRGLLRPERVVLVSPKVQRLIDSEKLKGCEIEVAHLV